VKSSVALVCAVGTLLAAGRPANADLPLSGIPIGAAVGALAQTLGTPTAVFSADSGHRFDFAGGATAYTDDDGIVLAVEARSGAPQLDVDGSVRTFAIGAYTTARADAELAAVAEFSAPGVRSYRLGPRRDLVLEFGSANKLARITFGEPGQLARLGLLPGDAASKAVVYRAPQARPAAVKIDGAADSAGPLVTVYRVAIDRAGSVRAADVLIPSASPARDADAERGLLRTRYVPASLDGRPIAATIFLELHHG
jgi:hypothetical protein